MTQFPHDEFAKNFLDSLLSPLGKVEVSQQISSEVRYADVYFTPQVNNVFSASRQWLRILGKGRVQEQAIQEVAALPTQHPQRNNVLDLGNLKVILEARTNIELEEQELIMQLSPLYLEKIQAAELVGEQRGEVKGNTQGRVEEARGLAIGLLTRKLGTVGSPLLETIQALPLEQVELLGEDLLDFTSMDNLEQWLSQN